MRWIQNSLYLRTPCASEAVVDVRSLLYISVLCLSKFIDLREHQDGDWNTRTTCGVKTRVWTRPTHSGTSFCSGPGSFSPAPSGSGRAAHLNRSAAAHRLRTKSSPPAQNLPQILRTSNSRHRQTNSPIDSDFCRQSTSHRHDGYVTRPPRSLLCASGRDSEIRFSLRTMAILLPVENSSPLLPLEPFLERERRRGICLEMMHRWSTRANMSILGPKG